VGGTTLSGPAKSSAGKEKKGGGSSGKIPSKGGKKKRAGESRCLERRVDGKEPAPKTNRPS